MDVGRPCPGGGCRVSPRLNRLESITAFAVRDLDTIAFKVRVKSSRIWIARMSVSTEGIRLPNLNLHTLYRFSLQVQNPARKVKNLTLSSAGLPLNEGQ